MTELLRTNGKVPLKTITKIRLRIKTALKRNFRNRHRRYLQKGLRGCQPYLTKIVVRSSMYGAPLPEEGALKSSFLTSQRKEISFSATEIPASLIKNSKISLDIYSKRLPCIIIYIITNEKKVGNFLEKTRGILGEFLQFQLIV